MLHLPIAKNKIILTYIVLYTVYSIHYTFIITRVQMYINCVSCMSMYLNCY